MGRVVIEALLLWHGSVEGEQGFSRSAQLITSMQARTDGRTLNSKFFVADALRNFDNKPELLTDHKKAAVFGQIS